MLVAHLPFQVLSSTVEVIRDVRTVTYLADTHSRYSGRTLAARIRQPLLSGDPHPEGTVIVADGFASAPTSTYHLEIAAFRLVAVPAPEDAWDTGSVDITGVIHQSLCEGRDCFTLEVERSDRTSWIVGIDMSLFPESIRKTMLPGMAIHVSGRFDRLSRADNVSDHLLVFYPFVLCKNIPSCAVRPPLFTTPIPDYYLPLSESPAQKESPSVRNPEAPVEPAMTSLTFGSPATDQSLATTNISSAAVTHGTIPTRASDGARRLAMEDRARGRRHALYKARGTALLTSNLVPDHVQRGAILSLWHRIGPAGMSSDEEDSDVHNGPPRLVKHRVPWRSEMFQQFLQGLDGIREEQRLEGRGPGPQRRIEGVRDSNRPAVRELPLGMYRTSWYRTLNSMERLVLNAIGGEDADL